MQNNGADVGNLTVCAQKSRYLFATVAYNRDLQPCRVHQPLYGQQAHHTEMENMLLATFLW